MKIRPVILDDAEAIAPLLGELGYPSTVEETRERLETLLGAAGIIVFVAEVDGAVAGVKTVAEISALLHQPGRIAQITMLVVGAAHRRLGVGRFLLEAGERWARERGCTRIVVASGEQRDDAHAFYESVGYRYASRRFNKDLGS